MNRIEHLLKQVAETGKAPSAEDWHGVVTHGSASERNFARNGVANAEKRIRGLQTGALDTDGDVDEAIREIIEEASEQFAHATTADPGTDQPKSGRQLADDIVKRRQEGTAGIEKRARAAAAERRAREPLREILVSASMGQHIQPDDLHELNLRGDTDRAAFERDVLTAAGRITSLREGGDHGRADAMVDEVTSKYGASLAEPRRVDPHAHLTDPGALADVIRGHARNSGRAL
jgi:hypothetical protein